MSLTDQQIISTSKKMKIPLEDCLFKDELNDIVFNKAYIINIQDSVDEEGNPNNGSHWVYLQCNKYPSNKIESIYFDPYGQPPPEGIKTLVEKITKQRLPHTSKDIQSLMNNACGFYCLAFGHFINSCNFRTNILYSDVETFLSMFDDLNVSIDFKKNEYILKHFFRSEDPSLRKTIDVDSIVKDDSGGVDMMKIPIDVKLNK
jgi:hypothetical protein